MKINYLNDLQKYNQNIAVITDNDKKISYKELIEHSNNIAKNIHNRNLIIIVCSNCYECLAGYIGFYRKGNVLILVDESINVIHLKKIITLYKPSYIYIPKNYNFIKTKYTSINSFLGYTLLKTNFRIEYNFYKYLAILLPTSGSTGSPRFVKLSYKNINSNAEAIAKYLKIKSVDRPIVTLPMSYSYGLSIINSHLLKGSSIILTTSSILKRQFWKLFKKYKATTFGGVPYIYFILNKLKFQKMKLPSLKYITQAGGKLDKDLLCKFKDICKNKNIKFIVMYGQTEATARISYLPWQNISKKVGSIGLAIPGGKLLLKDDKGKIIKKNNVIGELIYKGNNVMLGYAESYKDLFKGDENKGTLNTGDLAEKDHDGYYYIKGRKKRFLKIFGNRINLDDLEVIINKIGLDSACTGIDDNIKIFVTKKNNLDRISNYVTRVTGINRTALKVVYISKIPRNSSGKILYSELNIKDTKND